MIQHPAVPPDLLNALPTLPSWVTSARAKTPEDAAFLSGAALEALHVLLNREEVPRSLLRERLALRAAEACLKFSGRPERAGELRDELCLLRPGDLPGPAGEIYLHWRRAVERPISLNALDRALPRIGVSRITRWLDTGQGAPVTRAAMVLETVLTDAPRHEVVALILADVALALILGWGHPVPLLAARLKPAELRKRGDDLRWCCHRALARSAIETVGLAAGLTRRAGRLNAVVPKLRAKGAEEAVEMFLTRDAVAPSALPLPDRAARRLCDRLVDLGAIRELTGRDTFRLYGV